MICENDFHKRHPTPGLTQCRPGGIPRIHPRESPMSTPAYGPGIEIAGRITPEYAKATGQLAPSRRAR